MTVPTQTIWPLDPHTIAKHEILRLYLQRWFPILGKYHERVVYIDGFCGPGRYENGEPGSPLVALNVAVNHVAKLPEVVFLFIDESTDRIAHLESELEKMNLPSTFKVFPRDGRFDERLKSLLDRLDSTQGQISPTFAFIDPFGFAGVPFSLIQRLLSKPRCETLITFMVDSINRWLSHPNQQIRETVADIFGTTECFDVTGDSRTDYLRDLYQRQLQSAAMFVRYFEMRNRRGHVAYLLFFATNHRLGHLKMKEAMWAVDPNGEFRFSDTTNRAQHVLFGHDETPLLWPVLHAKFHGETVRVEAIQRFVEDETAFLPKHMRATLSKHESSEAMQQQRILVADKKADGAKRVKGTFPTGVLVTFPG